MQGTRGERVSPRVSTSSKDTRDAEHWAKSLAELVTPPVADGSPGGWPAGVRPRGWVISVVLPLHNHTCVLLPGTCREQGMPTRRFPTLVPLTHTHSEPWTQRPTDIPLVHSQRTHALKPSKPYWALPTHSHDNIPSSLSWEGRTRLGPPGAPSSLQLLFPSVPPAPTLAKVPRNSRGGGTSPPC